MLSGFGLRTGWAIVIAAIAAATVLVIDQSAQAALVTLVGGIAAALAAAGTGEDEAAAAAPAAEARGDALPVAELVEAITGPVLLVEAGRVTVANAAARALLGQHIVGDDARVAIRHSAAAEWLAAGADTLPDRGVELVGIGSPDHRWEMRVGAVGARRVVHLVDQTGNWAAERMRVDFVANASHELRTPLASILGYVETLSDEAGEDAAIRQRFLGIMWDEARRMQRLVEDLISLSRIEAEKYRLPDQAVDLAALLADVAAELRGGASPRVADLQVSVETEDARVAGDRPQLSQMLHNLIGNALKYGRAATPVVVRLRPDAAGMLRLAVRDEGEGIAAEHIPRLTERFYRADPGRSRALGGTGLGLAIVKHIVERHRGRLDIASQVGVGTTVAVTLPPLAAAPSPAPAPSLAPPNPLSSKGNVDVTRGPA